MSLARICKIKMRSLLCFLALGGCTTPYSPWVVVLTITQSPCFNSGRLYLARASNSCLELEIDRGRSGIRMYLNILVFQAPPSPDDPDLSCIDLILPEEDGEQEEKIEVIYAYRLEGGQRLWIPPEVANPLIQRLLQGKSFIFKLGNHEAVVIPEQFEVNYQSLLSISIEELSN